MLIGASTKGFGGLSVGRVAELFADAGLSCAELCLCHEGLDGWHYNSDKCYPLPSAADIRAAVETFASVGIRVNALGAYCNLAVGDGCDAALQLCEYIDRARLSGIDTVCTHSGVRPIYVREKGNKEILRSTAITGLFKACVEAKKCGVTLALESPLNDVLGGCHGFKSVSDELGGLIGDTDMLKYIASPVESVKDVVHLEEIAMYHIKSLTPDGRLYTTIGEGTGETDGFYESLRECEKPLIFEFVSSSNLRESVGVLRSFVGL